MFNSALNIIYDEHRSLAAVVQGLRHLVGEYRRRRGSVDFKLLHAIVFYLDEFPQKLHHPKEDAYLFARLQRRTHIADTIIAELREQHAQGMHHVGNLRAALDRFAADEANGIENFSVAIEQFAADILRHMALEESVLIPLARRYLSAEDWVEISVAFGENGDPRFFADEEHDFAELFSRILMLAAPADDPDYRTGQPGS